MKEQSTMNMRLLKKQIYGKQMAAFDVLLEMFMISLGADDCYLREEFEKRFQWAPVLDEQQCHIYWCLAEECAGVRLMGIALSLCQLTPYEARKLYSLCEIVKAWNTKELKNLQRTGFGHDTGIESTKEALELIYKFHESDFAQLGD